MRALYADRDVITLLEKPHVMLGASRKIVFS